MIRSPFQNLCYANPHAVTSIGGTATSTYDNNGNLLTYKSGSSATTTYTWDYRNRMTQSVVAGNPTAYGYDINDQRVQMGTTLYPFTLYNTQGSTSTITKHIFANGQAIADIQGSGATTSVYYLHADHLNGTNVVGNSSSNVDQLYAYYPYGAQRVAEQSGSFTEQRQFIGQEYDAGTSLNYLNARYYNSAQGQFLSEDPTHLAVGNAQQMRQLADQSKVVYLADPQQLNSGRTTGLNSISGFGNSPAKKNWTSIQTEYLRDPQLQNSYSYGRNNPITMSDPTGEIPILPIFAAYGAIQMAIHAYEAKTVFIDYPEVFSSQDKYQTGFNLGLDVVLFGAGKAAKDIGQRAVLEVGPAILDVMDHYFGEQIYKNVNSNSTQAKPDSSNKKY